jgi:hypothetical protein
MLIFQLEYDVTFLTASVGRQSLVLFIGYVAVPL